MFRFGPGDVRFVQSGNERSSGMSGHKAPHSHRSGLRTQTIYSPTSPSRAPQQPPLPRASRQAAYVFHSPYTSSISNPCSILAPNLASTVQNPSGSSTNRQALRPKHPTLHPPARLTVTQLHSRSIIKVDLSSSCRAQRLLWWRRCWPPLAPLQTLCKQAHSELSEPRRLPVSDRHPR